MRLNASWSDRGPKVRCLVWIPEGAHVIHILPWWTVIKVFIIASMHYFFKDVSCGLIIIILCSTDLVSSGGHFEVTFNALRHGALWGFNDRSHGTNPDCWLDNTKQAILICVIDQRIYIDNAYNNIAQHNSKVDQANETAESYHNSLDAISSQITEANEKHGRELFHSISWMLVVEVNVGNIFCLVQPPT